ncbi:TPA: RNA-binding protein [Candidatus Micrarchaeota archaeon]|nr:RNA-binding protein [Candidatus Micrarchaeota archaeon]
MKRCTSCGSQTKEFAEFPCPQCSEKIVRCYSCRLNKNEFKCACGFNGP